MTDIRDDRTLRIRFFGFISSKLPWELKLQCMIKVLHEVLEHEDVPNKYKQAMCVNTIRAMMSFSYLHDMSEPLPWHHLEKNEQRIKETNNEDDQEGTGSV